MTDYLSGLCLAELLAPRRDIFVSYHHAGDQYWYGEFCRFFCATYNVFRDNSLRGRINSDNPEYVRQRIRESYITGSSCTIVLCGTDTPLRKYVDWEIGATLDKVHGLIGVQLPTLRPDPYAPYPYRNQVTVPQRLQDNLDSGYGVWTSLELITASPDVLRWNIEYANARPGSLVANMRPLRDRNGPP